MSEKRMKSKGFSLLELLIVIAIMSIIFAIAGLSYNSWMKKYRLEGQVRELYVDLLNARVQAMQMNHVYWVDMAASSYAIKADANDNGVVDDPVIRTKQFEYPLTSPVNVALNARGIVSPLATITFNTGGINAAYDCITLSPTRIRMGKYYGANCIAR
jgi:prepilin-type N-terminal cleavage/methylation domain-containing protein